MADPSRVVAFPLRQRLNEHPAADDPQEMAVRKWAAALVEDALRWYLRRYPGGNFPPLWDKICAAALPYLEASRIRHIEDTTENDPHVGWAGLRGIS